jgi:hypothetical protein
VAETLAGPGEKTLSRSLDTRAARRTSAVPAREGGSWSAGGAAPSSTWASRPCSSAAGAGKRCTTVSTDTDGSSSPVGSPRSTTTATLAASSEGCSSGSNSRASRRQ